jgi:hypothetical protein
MKPITPDQPAVTVGSVTTPDLVQAFLDAHALVEANPAMKGVILHRDDPYESQVNWLGGDWQVTGLQAFNFGRGAVTGYEATFLATPDFADKHGTFQRTARYPDTKPSTIETIVMDPPRLARLEALTSMFGYVRGDIHFESRNDFYPHFDSEGLPVEDYYDRDHLFGGRHLRYLQIHQGPGTLILDGGHTYDLDDDMGYPIINAHSTGVENTRALRTGDIMLFFDAKWGRERALPHGSPPFTLNGDNGYRIMDSYDLGAGFKLAEIKASLG